MRWLSAVFGLSVFAWTASAQGRYDGPLPAAIEWSVVQRTQNQVLLDVFLRNVSGYTFDAFWTLGAVVVNGGCVGCSSPSYPMNVRTVGAVDLRDLASDEANPLAADVDSWRFGNSTLGRIRGVGPWSQYGPRLSEPGGVGLLGCTIPVSAMLVAPRLPGEDLSYAGRTCANDGFTGAVAFTIGFAVPDLAAALAFSEANVTITPEMKFIQSPVITTPEPTTFAALGFALVVLGAVARRRTEGRPTA